MTTCRHLVMLNWSIEDKEHERCHHNTCAASVLALLEMDPESAPDYDRAWVPVFFTSGTNSIARDINTMRQLRLAAESYGNVDNSVA